MKGQRVLSRLWVVGLVMVLLSVPMVALADQPAFSATIDITGNPGLNIVVGQTTTLTAAWTTNRDVNRYEWLVADIGQGVGVFEGSSAGSQDFLFSGYPAGEYEVCFRIWHHTQTDRTATKCETVYVTEACQWVGETAWAAGTRYENPGNWATYTAYDGTDKMVDLLAGQDMEAGTVHFPAVVDGKVTITIMLHPGWRFKGVDENVKIQDYATAPSGNPAPGQFSSKGTADASPFSIEVPANNFYGVHVDVEQQVCS